jgi:hypothetical protein
VRVLRLSIAAIFAVGLLLGGARLVWTDLPGPARSIAAQLGINAANFQTTLEGIDNRIAARLQEGDWDDLIYYILQSRSFTELDPIEPSRSAIEFHRAAEMPAGFSARVKAFLVAMQAPSNERILYLSKLRPTREKIAKQYGRSMEFLYEKEVHCRERDNPQACIANLYSHRGLSTDTSMPAFRIVEEAVGWIRANKPAFRARRVLILGPGVDFSPRTGLREDTRPRVYQPEQVRDLLHPEVVGCVDINPLAISYAKETCVGAYQLNIATARVDGEGWDLIIATNVLLYLDDRELLLAMNNIRHMLNPGGMFVHNDARFQVNVFGRACGLPVIRFEEIVLDAVRKPPSIDRYVLHETAGATGS